MYGEVCAVVGVEGGDDEGELDGRNGAGAGEEKVALVVSVGECTERRRSEYGVGGRRVGGGGHCCAAGAGCGVRRGGGAPRLGGLINFFCF